MIKKLFKAVFIICGGLLGYGISLLLRDLTIGTNFGETLMFTETGKLIFSLACSAITAFIFFLLAPTLSKQGQKVAKDIESDLQKIPTTEILPGTFGLLVGVFLAYLISQLYQAFQMPYIAVVLSVFTYLTLGYLGVFVATRRGKEIITALAAARKGTTGKGKNKGDASPKILDTSVIIDGRIADIMKTGFVEGEIVIPEFVLVELRHIADSSDNLKRNRGRRGLDVLNKIQMDYGIEIYNTTGDKSIEEIPEVDVKLLKLAQNLDGKVMTNDYNLNKVAVIKGVEVLNINELANMLKPVVLPGEEMELFLVKEGKESDQAVAYLDDGTMIVVEEGKKYIGQSIGVIVTSVLQTAAGRMIFGKPKKGR